MTTNPVNTTTTITPPTTQKQPLCSIQASKYQRIAAAITLLAGIVLIGSLVGALVFFALSTSTALTALIGIALCASVILLSMAMYQLVARCRQVPSDPKGIEDSVTLKEEITAIKAQLTQKTIQLMEEEEHSASLLGQLLAITGDLEVTQHQKAALEAEVKLLKEQYTSTLKLVEKDHPELVEVQQELAAKTAQLEDFVKTTALLGQQIEGLKAVVASSKEEITKLKDGSLKLEEQLKVLQEGAAGTDGEQIGKLELQIAGKTEEIEKLQAEIKTLQAALQAEQDAGTQEELSLKVQLEEAQALVMEKEEEIAALKQQIAVLEQRNKDLVKDGMDLANEISAKVADYETQQEKEKEKLAQRIQELEIMILQKSQELGDAKAKILDLEMALENSSEESEQIRKVVAELEKQIAEKEQEIVQLNARVAELEAAAVVKAPESAEASETVEVTEEV